ncbi:MAG: hypothetical protein M1818_008002 [Claussenomyces sp. TS43310]|nr:MAG: hypothetical protein M1818_008002 [Claussenomyces sp. TS43310]
MKLSILSLLTIATAVLAVTAPQKAVIVTYPANTPNSVIDQAMNAIKSAGGIITHEYKLIKGFAAKAPEKVLETVSAWGVEYNAVVEDDGLVQTNGHKGG